MNFGDLKDDQLIKTKISNVYASIDKLKGILDVASKNNNFDQLELMDKINYDLFLSYTLNTLYWMYLRTKGIDPNQNHIKNELNRVKDYMLKAKAAHERITIRPRIKKDVAHRFVKHGIWNLPEAEPAKNSEQPPNKKTKLS